MPTYEDAYKDAIANARNEQPFTTIEVINTSYLHPDTGDIQILRVINDNVDMEGLIEANAEYNAGEVVTFARCVFRATPKRGLTYELIIENIGADLLIPLRAASASGVKTKVNIRHYFRSTSKFGSSGQIERLTVSSVSHSVGDGTISIKFNVLEKLANNFPRSLHGTK